MLRHTHTCIHSPPKLPSHPCYQITLSRVPWGFPGGLDGKDSACSARDLGSIPGLRRSPWRRKWQPPPVSLLGEFHGQRSLADYSSWGCKKSDTTEQLTLSHHIYIYVCIYLCVCVYICAMLCLVTGSNPGLLHCRQILYQLSYQGRPYMCAHVSVCLSYVFAGSIDFT